MKTLSIIRNNRSYIGFTMLLFIAGLLLGLSFSEAFDELLKAQIEHIKNLAEKADGNSTKLATVIFLNNLKVSLLLLATGVLLSIFPIVMIMGNGMAIGYLFASFGGTVPVPLWAIIVYGIVPHGIFEIPAFILAGAMGIKLGFMWLRPLKGESRWNSFLYAGKESLRILPLILVLLVIAASVEGFVTPALLRWYMG